MRGKRIRIARVSGEGYIMLYGKGGYDMLLKWYGHSCFLMTFADGYAIAADPFDASVGYALCDARADLALVSHGHGDHSFVSSLQGSPRVLTEPGAAEIPGGRVTGYAGFHDDAQGAKRGKNTIFKVEREGLTIVHLGDLGAEPDADTLSKLQNADLLMIPIGGFYTIDTPAAVALIGKLRAKRVVPMHFKTPVMRFPISDETEFVRLTGAGRVGREIALLPGAWDGKTVCSVMRFED